jgi:glycosyltransferase involved in cell wall biosynthesis
MADSAKSAQTQNDAMASQQNPMADSEPASLRLLLIAPASPPPHLTGGMDVAAANVAAELRKRGWAVDMPFAAASETSTGDAATSAHTALHKPSTMRPSSPLLTLLLRSRLRSFIRLPRFLQGYPSLFVDRMTIRKFNDNLLAVERVLKTAPRPDAILLFSGYATPGVCALALATNPRTVLVSTSEPAFELKLARAWRLARKIWAWRLQGQIHPFLYRPATPNQMGCVVFISEGWKEEAIQHGLSASRARTIYFGVPQSPMTGRAPPRGRLLCVGRMNRGKGLHHFVEAMPAIRKAIPEATLTIIAKREDDAYQASIVKTIATQQLGDVVRLLPRVSSAELENAYAGHDALLYVSPFSEPVPLVMMEAFMAGLPVIISKPRAPSPLVQPDHTCLCFDPGKPATLVEAIRRLHEDAALRARLTANARTLVDGPFSLDRMGAQYDALLRMVASKSETGTAGG